VVLPRTYGRGPVRPPAQMPGCRFFCREEELFARSQTHPSVAQFQALGSGTLRFLSQNCAREERLVNCSDTEQPIPCRIHQTSQRTLLFSIWCWLQCFCFLSVNAGDSRSPGRDATTRAPYHVPSFQTQSTGPGDAEAQRTAVACGNDGLRISLASLTARSTWMPWKTLGT
jgi:hypothetical protein